MNRLTYCDQPITAGFSNRDPSIRFDRSRELFSWPPPAKQLESIQEPMPCQSFPWSTSCPSLAPPGNASPCTPEDRALYHTPVGEGDGRPDRRFYPSHPSTRPATQTRGYACKDAPRTWLFVLWNASNGCTIPHFKEKISASSLYAAKKVASTDQRAFNTRFGSFPAAIHHPDSQHSRGAQPDTVELGNAHGGKECAVYECGSGLSSLDCQFG